MNANISTSSKGAIGVVLIIVACASLFIDHAALIIDKNATFFGMSIYDTMRAAGRIAFPMFVFMIAEWCYQSKNLKKTIAILFVFALITEFCGRLFYNDWSVFDRPTNSSDAKFIILNLTTSSMFTFLYGALGIYAYDRLKDKKMHPAVKYIPAVMFAIVGQIAGCSFLGLGVLLVFVLYVIRAKFPDMNDLATRNKADLYRALAYAFLLIPIYFFRGMWLLPFAFFGVLFTFAFNGVVRKNSEYILYIFYPVHFLVLYGIQLLM